jgi:hypothetical protein
MHQVRVGVPLETDHRSRLQGGNPVTRPVAPTAGVGSAALLPCQDHLLVLWYRRRWWTRPWYDEPGIVVRGSRIVGAAHSRLGAATFAVIPVATLAALTAAATSTLVGGR